MRFIVLILTLLIILPTNVLHAQFNGNVSAGSLLITIEPEYPQPNEPITATIDDYSLNATGATIVWLIDGVEAVNVVNQRSIKLTAPALGKSMKIGARLVTPGKFPVDASKIITPLYFDLVVEPLTYTPVFYQGRALPVFGSQVNVTALLHDITGVVSPSNYTYTWQFNGTSIYGGPKNGTNRAQITVPYGNDSIVAVTIQDKSGVTVMRKLVSIPSKKVSLRFYEQNILYGLSKKSIGSTLHFVGNNTTIRAVPYNIDMRVGNQNFLTQWSIDGLKTNTGNTDPFEINLERQTSGQALVSFQVRNLVTLLQGDEQSFRVSF
jgi:hypothetical protein